MRLICPLCGDRDSREFSYLGDTKLMDRPDGDAGLQAFHAYLHIRDNPAGPHRELWHHGQGCGAWLCVERNTVTHAITNVVLAREAKR